ncbi:hypothetical protein [Acinetobacter modestus]|uniref:hypothetical protein n=1 Tax=Acinetobacter modestus TaxID=1776740 RepID=UPI001F4A221D|nr:hypothetical protein [Acinetobacter modestus]MCH7328970.1 hypothetical protein [Acinetobacter modestus]
MMVIDKADLPVGMSVEDYKHLSSDCLHKLRTQGIYSKEVQQSLKLVLTHASDSGLESFYQWARDLGFIPPVYGYLDDGTPVFNAKVTAEHTGLSIEAVNQLIEILAIRRELQGLDAITPDQINRAQ